MNSCAWSAHPASPLARVYLSGRSSSPVNRRNCSSTTQLFIMKASSKWPGLMLMIASFFPLFSFYGRLLHQSCVRHRGQEDGQPWVLSWSREQSHEADRPESNDHGTKCNGVTELQKQRKIKRLILPEEMKLYSLQN